MQRTIQDNVQDQASIRASVSDANYNSLIRLMSEHGFTLPARQMPKWRPTVATRGTIPGIDRDVICIATDGILGIFIDGTGQDLPPLDGHVKHFSWTTPIETMVPYIDSEGRQRFFKQVRDSGAPSALHSMPKRPRPANGTSPAKSRGPRTPSQKSIAAALEVLASLQPKDEPMFSRYNSMQITQIPSR